MLALFLAASLLSPENELLRDHKRLDHFYALGFSRTGLFAYVTTGDGDEAGYTSYWIHVVDLVNDTVVEQSSVTDEQGGVPLVDFGLRIHDVMARHDIEAGGTRVGQSFVAEQAFRVALSTVDEGGSLRRTSVFLERDGRRKRIAVVREGSELDGAAPHFVETIVSPFERRAAVILADSRYGGCVGGRLAPIVVGADLDARF